MRWFRPKLRVGSRLALFALAVQIALSFGHVHLDTLARAPAPGSGKVLLSDRAPSHDSSGALDRDCPICALIQLVGSSAPGATPALPLPPDHRMIRPQAVTVLALAAPSRQVFQARGPPV